MNIVQLFLDKSRQKPDAPALTAGDTTLSFGDLSKRITHLAGAIRERLGLRPGDRAALWMENRAEFVEILLACWVAGVCVVPVNYKLHPRELEHIVGDSGAKFVFTSAHLADTLKDRLQGWSDGVVITVESDEYLSLQNGKPIAAYPGVPDDLAWIFYTSGTTGFPKGAMLSHRNLIFMSMAYYSDIEQVGFGQTMIHTAPLSHGSGQYMLPHLLAGGHQIILRRFDPDQLLNELQRYASVSLFLVPTMITRLVQAVKSRPDWKSDINYILYGGSPMYVADLVEAMQCFGPRFYQLYGQGESPMTISGLDRRHHENAYSSANYDVLATVGVPRTGVEVRVVDEAGTDVPPGELGEIITRSDCVMRGYWNNEAATKTTLRDGWLWTGDIGALDERGYLSLRDRSKDMIISGGSNIYPREIEEILLTHPGVSECSVVGRPHQDLGEEVVAFVVCHAASRVTEKELDDLCISKMARFKRPRAYRFVDDLPKSGYGKILKKALRDQLKSEFHPNI
ncbi:AMP-binding protein [Castellaniella sp.]|uniref:AMP-binding protein n=1 Tax=Castellaniella sp. TaxID=1955812 RepID=UPI003566BBBC